MFVARAPLAQERPRERTGIGSRRKGLFSAENMDSHLRPHKLKNFAALMSSSWVASDSGRKILAGRTSTAVRLFLEEGLEGRLRREQEASRAGGSKVFRIANSLRLLCDEMTILALAHQVEPACVPEAAWAAAQSVWARTLNVNSLNFHESRPGRPRKSDLYTADIGVSLAFTGSLETPLEVDRSRLRDFLEIRSWRPIVEDWVDGASRIHSLDSMGHNWWSVIVGGAGVMAQLLGWEERAAEIAMQLREWFAYPGNEAFRKQPNFGCSGDYLESFSYGEYGLLSPFVLAFLRSQDIVPDWLSPEQCRGMADWYKQAFVKTRKGYWPRRFGDVSPGYRPNAVVWHTLARLTGDRELLELAHRIKPEPGKVFEFLMWEDHAPEGNGKSSREPARVFPVSGTAFLGGKAFSIAVRAGEFWNHNHLDAGTFIFAQDGTVWVDDGGTCKYSSPDYLDHYVLPQAHNVAYVPELIPVDQEIRHLELGLSGRFLSHARVPGVEALQVETGVLSGGRLARSYRRFFILDEEVAVIWDDLEAYEERCFEFLLHTLCRVESPSGSAPGSLVSENGQRCPLHFFSDTPCGFSTAPAKMGDIPPPDGSSPADPIGVFEGAGLRWQGQEKSRRQKFGLAMGQGLRAARWNMVESGWECVLETGASRWSLWLNRMADGRVAHANTIGAWKGFETDAYALLLQEKGGEQFLTGVDVSFIRTESAALHNTLKRSPLIGLGR